MNVSEYIESGILDIYVLKGLSTEEKLEVESLAMQYPEIAEEISRIQNTLEQVAIDTAVIPSQSVKENLFQKISSTPDSFQTTVQSPDNEKVVSFKSTNLFWVMAASWLLALVLGGMALFYRNQWHSAENKILALQNQNKELAESYNLTKTEAGRVSSQLSFVSDTTVKLVTLKNVPSKPHYAAHLFWSKKNGEVLLSAHYLPKAPEGKQFQLWAIVDGKPVDAGMVSESGTNVLMKMKNIPTASAFAITLENIGGSPVPTMDEMYVMGAV